MRILTFDVEHWFEGYRHRQVNGWQDFPLRDDRPVLHLLDLLGEKKQRCTLFVTGRYACDFPHVVRRAAEAGHEIASHSYEHIVLDRLDREGFRQDLKKSISVIEDVIGVKVFGYRAPKWSISSRNSRWVYEALLEFGLLYDSSVFPGLLGCGNIFPRKVCLGDAGGLWEIPASTLRVMGFQLPAAGGLYFRVLPMLATRLALKQAEREARPAMVYLHPYDLDPTSPVLSDGGPLLRFARRIGVGSALGRLEALLDDSQFGSVMDYLPCLDEALTSASSARVVSKMGW